MGLGSYLYLIVHVRQEQRKEGLKKLAADEVGRLLIKPFWLPQQFQIGLNRVNAARKLLIGSGQPFQQVTWETVWPVLADLAPLALPCAVTRLKDCNPDPEAAAALAYDSQAWLDSEWTLWSQRFLSDKFQFHYPYFVCPF